MSFEVLKPGLLSTFQDLGRLQHQRLGIPVAGALDVHAHRLANLLVGNGAEFASLEMNLFPPTLKTNSACCIAFSGADMGPMINDFRAPMNRPLVLRPQDEISFEGRTEGARVYMAVHGGFKLKSVFDSSSTYLRSAMGGFQGRALKRGDVVDINTSFDDIDLSLLAQELWDVKIYLKSSLVKKTQPKLRIIKSAQWDEFTPESRADLITKPFKVTPISDRMGLRLEGPELKLSRPRQMSSESVVFGTIQVPVGGQAIVLMADRQPTGGYPKIAYVASVDQPLLAQLAPGDTFTFTLIDMADAQKLDAKRELDFLDLAKQLEPIRTLLNHATASGQVPAMTP
jgi:antagonist of KipI